MKIAIIGAGNMGGSIARGLAKGSLIDDSDIIVSNPSAGKLEKLKKEFPGISTTNNNLEAATGADIVILAVKPWFMESVMRELKLKSKQILISVAAGISFEELAHYVVAPEMPMFRLIPNTAISELESMTLVAARNTNDEQDNFILRLFSEMGTVMLIPEDKIAAATALASCGIAYVLKYIHRCGNRRAVCGYPKPSESPLNCSLSIGTSSMDGYFSKIYATFSSSSFFEKVQVE